MPPLPYEFRVLKTNDVGAFSLPGGIIYVTLGMLRTTDMEGQFASALAHELAHQELNHPLISWRKRVNANRGKKVVLDFNGSFPVVFLGPDGALSYPIGMDEEADELAPVILHRAKFDPRAYASYLEMIKRIDALDPDRAAMITMVQPPIAKRIEWVKTELTKIPPFKDPRLSTQSFEEIKQILKRAELKGKAKKQNDEEGE
jgi:predicted Zn-dependent protease